MRPVEGEPPKQNQIKFFDFKIPHMFAVIMISVETKKKKNI